MFNIYNIVFYKVNFQHSTLSTIKKCKNQGYVESREEFEHRFGVIQNEKCHFDGAYNDIISDAYISLIPQNDDLFSRNNFHFFTTKDTLWVCTSKNNKYMDATWYVAALLVAYVLSQLSNKDEYKNIKKLGLVYNGNLFMQTENRHNIEIVDIKDISDRVFANICRNYIGYNTLRYDFSWRKSSGTNMDKLAALYDFYRDCLPIEISVPISTNMNQIKKLEFEELNTALMVTEQTKLELQNIRTEECSFSKTGLRNIFVNYISDIHLEHHIDFEKPIKPQIVRICKQLSDSHTRNSIILIAGDTGTEIGLCTMFYHTLKMLEMYKHYKMYGKDPLVQIALSENDAIEKAEAKECMLQNKLNSAQVRLKNATKYFKYKGNYEELLGICCPEPRREKYAVIASEYQKLKKSKRHLEDFQEKKMEYIKNLQQFHCISKYVPSIFVTLGNHELAAFNTVEEGVTYYRNFFKREGMIFLHNDIYEAKDYCIIGGIGFAKYNKKYNASTLMGARTMAIDDEIKESETFYNTYLKALSIADVKQEPLIVLSHYPTNDWLPNNEYNSLCFYFNGHNHRNTFVQNGRCNICADNQVGYKSKKYLFKEFVIGTIRNPFIDFDDGCYEVTPSQYEKYNHYIGKNIRGTYFIDNALSSGTATLYMIKLVGYYGFFIIDKSKNAKICYGGHISSIDGSKGRLIDYFFQRFIAMLKAQIGAFSGYNHTQNTIRSEIRELGFDGTIHGSIVDIDFYHHIMLNPFDGSITYYYSPSYGVVESYSTFSILLESSLKRSLEPQKYNEVLKKYEKMQKKNVLIGKSSIDAEDSGLQKVSLKGGMYGVSRKMNQFQKLFDSNMLCVWNEEFLKGTPFEVEEK